MIPYREASFIVPFDYIDGSGRLLVDAELTRNEEQPAASQQRRRVGEHRPYGLLRPVLEDLYGDHVVEQPLRMEVQKVSLDQLGRQTRMACPELPERFLRRVEPDNVQTRVGEGNVVASVPAANV